MKILDRVDHLAKAKIRVLFSFFGKNRFSEIRYIYVCIALYEV